MRKTRSTMLGGSASISRIFSLASTLKDGEPEISRRYVKMAEKVAKRLDITLSKEIKRAYCKKCKSAYDSETKVRLSGGLVSVTCQECGDIRRIPYR